MKTLEIDIETFSSTDLKKAGVYKYAESPDFEILLFGYSDVGIEKQPLTNKLNTVKNKINGLNVVGGTNIGDGLRLGYYRLKGGAAD
jgi:hypothetical protein